MNPKRQMPVRKSLNREATLMGVERIPAAFLILICAILVFSGMTLVTVTLGVVIFVLGMFCLRQMAIEHPKMSKVFPRYIKYKKFYPARVKRPAPSPHLEVIAISRKG